MTNPDGRVLGWVADLTGGGAVTVAALATPPDMGWFPASISAQGRPDLDRAILLERRDAFLRRALDHLG